MRSNGFESPLRSMKPSEERLTDPMRTLITSAGELSSPTDGEVASLVILRGADLQPPTPIGPEGLIVGRSPECGICLEHDSVSRLHFSIEPCVAGYLVRDLGSTNGTFINSRKIDRALVQNGDLIRVGQITLKFIQGAAEGAYHEELYRLVTLDPLTQAYNRRHFEQELAREHSRSVRYGRKFSLILFDFDHFKEINDQFGHLAGDAVLKEAAAQIRERLRRDDILARVGGEEFAILCPESDLDGACHLASDLGELIRKLRVIYEGLTIQATISLGVTEWSGEDETPDALYQRADRLLYEAKERGRDRYCR